MAAWTAGVRAPDSTVTNTTAAAHTGTHSLLTTGRIANYDGPQINVSNKMYNGSQLQHQRWVMLLPPTAQATSST